MQYQGLFWSAIIRALLSLRRDLSINDDRDITILDNVAALESGNLPEDTLANVIKALCPINHRQQLSRSLIGYFDFNKMSNLVVLLTASKHIDDALCVMGKQYRHLLGSAADLTITRDNDTTSLVFNVGKHAILTDMRCYFLLALFRHLAGRKFDFQSISLPLNNEDPLLASLTKATIKPSSKQVTLTFESKWLTHPSFFYSQSIQKMLSSTLEEKDDVPLKQQIKAVFQQAASPARIRTEWVASQLGQTESALRRQLRQESISFSALLKEFIHDQSCHLLLSGVKTDDAADQLGFADRRSFERSFKEHTGISAGQLRQIGSRLRFQKGNGNLLGVVENLPPLPNSIQRLLNMDEDEMTLPKVVSLIERDPIFQAHIMSKASRAIYGTPPKSLEQAIGRNLGLGNIRHLAVIFAAQQLLTSQCRFTQISQLTDSMLLSSELFNALFGFNKLTEDEGEQIKQLLLFGTLSLFLIFHDECLFADGALTNWEASESFADFVERINENYGICLYGATSLMLLRWGFHSAINQQLWKLCNPEASADLQNLPEQIRFCHNIAFSTLMKKASPLTLASEVELTAEQTKGLAVVISKWETSAP
ncbi:helix-turn-helix domain-containing protein [Alteromonas sp. 14N.309.X.WAT.G.H12]|uniref:helix-turn-helix domain-containing protein n=1 Tax=Alteromonas sp. 14N.309.X.WAT.G.H12 TaxID=3120824 RepID=UPI002FD391FE